MTERQKLVDQLLIHEGERLFPYTDSVGKLTIGVGRNLTDKGISPAESMMLLEHDIDEAITSLLAVCPWVARLDAVRQRVMIDLAFNMGTTKLLTFKRTLRLVKEGDYAGAADALQHSLWFRQVKSRGVRLVRWMRTGEDLF